MYLPQSRLPTRLIVRLALLSEIAVMNFSEGFILEGPYVHVQMAEGLDVNEDLKGTVKVIFFPEMFLAMMVLEVPMLSRRYLSPEVTLSLSFT